MRNTKRSQLPEWLMAAGILFSGLLPGYAQSESSSSFESKTSSSRRPGTVVKVDLIGDSTQTDNAGYGRGFCANLTEKVDCVNLAKGGTSTRTFRELGLWDRALATKPDYMLIQFGHNDKVTGKEPVGRQVALPQYADNLKRFVTEARAAGIIPVLVTPITNRLFKNDGKVHSDLTEYSEVMCSVAHQMKTPLIDLQNESIEYLDKIGEGEGTKLGNTMKDAGGKTVTDKTHLNWEGSYVFGRMVAVGLGDAVGTLKPYVRPTPASLPPEGEKDMRIFHGATVTIVLVGDSTVAPEGGWGPGFCAVQTPNVTCIDAALNGRSTKSFIDEGSWKRALAHHGDYYLIQFGHNDEKPDIERHTDPQTTYAANLKRFINDARAIGAAPIVLSPLSRRTFKDGKPSNPSLRLYAEAARRVAEEENVTYIDLLSLSEELLSTMTQEQADDFDAAVHADQVAENGKVPLDRTHLNDLGKKVFGWMVADNLSRWRVELGPDLIGQATEPLQLPTASAAVVK